MLRKLSKWLPPIEWVSNVLAELNNSENEKFCFELAKFRLLRLSIKLSQQ